MDRAEQMREAAVLALKSATGFDEDHPAVGAIRALPLPPQPPLADDVAGTLARFDAVRLQYGNGICTVGGAGVLNDVQDLIERLAGELAASKADAIRAWSRADKELYRWRIAQDRVEKAEAEVARLREVLTGLITCVEDGCFCSEMKMATAISEARAALTPKGADHE